jgi:hypothetical protein
MLIVFGVQNPPRCVAVPGTGRINFAGWPMVAHRCSRITLGVALWTLASLSHGDGMQKIDQINVFGHYETGVGTSDAASAGYITPQLIDDRPLLRPGEVLEYIPGMIVTQHSGAGKANQYFLRGFNLDHGTDFSTYVAGMPVNMRTHAHGQGWSAVRHWLAMSLLTELLPTLLTSVEGRLAGLLRGVSR